MTTIFVTRHPGAREWAERRRLRVDRFVEHLAPAQLAAGDRVVGTLPVNLAAELCAREIEYWHLALKLRPDQRGRELTADDLDDAGAELVRYQVSRVDGDPL